VFEHQLTIKPAGFTADTVELLELRRRRHTPPPRAHYRIALAA
jgi:hypothetical protein